MGLLCTCITSPVPTESSRNFAYVLIVCHAMPEATLDHPTVPEMSHSMSEVTDLTKLVRFVEDGIAHFIKL